MKSLPKPECILGYPEIQVERILGRQMSRFKEWMRGQTMGICDGRLYNHGKREYEGTGCGPHGVVAYASDLNAFLHGQPPLD